NLGNALLALGDPPGALARFELSLSITAGAPAPQGDAGALASIVNSCNPRRPLNPAEESCFMNLVRANCWRSPATEWDALCDAALRQEGLGAASRFELLVRKAIRHWMAGDLPAMARTLDQTSLASGLIGPSKSKDVRNSRAYEKFLRNLWRYA